MGVQLKNFSLVVVASERELRNCILNALAQNRTGLTLQALRELSFHALASGAQLTNASFQTVASFAWDQALGIKYGAPFSWCRVLGTKHVVLCAWHNQLDTRSAWHHVPGAFRQKLGWHVCQALDTMMCFSCEHRQWHACDVKSSTKRYKLRRASDHCSMMLLSRCDEDLVLNKCRVANRQS